MRRLLFAVAIYGMTFAPAHADIITTFDDWKLNPITVGDATFTYLGGGTNFNNDLMLFSDEVFPTQTVYGLNIFFDPSLNDVTVDLDYSVTVGNLSNEIVGLGVDSIIGSLGTNFNVTRTYYSSPGHTGQVATLTSFNGSNASVLGDFNTTIYTHVTAVIPASNVLQSFRDEYIQDTTGNSNAVPEPATFALLSIGAMGIGVSAFRKRRTPTMSHA